jgi:alginate O-acetyltransferase complex protein AlgI
MTLRDILIFLALALLLRLLAAGYARIRRDSAAGITAWKHGVLFAASVLALFWLQPSMPVRNLDFWLPLGTLALAVWGWIATTPAGSRISWRENLPWLGAAAGLVLLVAATRFLSPTGVITASRPPQFELVLAGLLLVAGFAALLAWVAKLLAVRTEALQAEGKAAKAGAGAWLPGALILFLLGLFIILKTPALSQAASAGLRGLMGQPVNLAGALDLRWLGFSYIAFRLIHTLRERQAAKVGGKPGKAAPANFREYLTYLIFFPALTAGPIDRVERFVKDLRAPLAPLMSDLLPAGERLAQGLFKKFVLAGSLALFSLSPENAAQIHGAGWMALALAAYALQIYFDFSGYTDIAIGLGRLLGVQLPENFKAPYLKPNLTQFWNNWHMTLTQWFRAYYFNPVTRWLRTGARPLPMALIIWC